MTPAVVLSVLAASWGAGLLLGLFARLIGGR